MRRFVNRFVVADFLDDNRAGYFEIKKRAQIDPEFRSRLIDALPYTNKLREELIRDASPDAPSSKVQPVHTHVTSPPLQSSNGTSASSHIPQNSTPPDRASSIRTDTSRSHHDQSTLPVVVHETAFHNEMPVTLGEHHVVQPYQDPYSTDEESSHVQAGTHAEETQILEDTQLLDATQILTSQSSAQAAAQSERRIAKRADDSAPSGDGQPETPAIQKLRSELALCLLSFFSA